jgi:hypothetical protein
MKEVTKDEFVDFVKKYPNKLDWDVAHMVDPPMGSYNDFSDGKKWPESMIAKVKLRTKIMSDNDNKNDYWIAI